jgi:hypothetical protein
MRASSQASSTIPIPTAERLSRIATGLGLDVDSPLLVIAATGDDVRALRVIISDHVRAGGTMFTHHLGEVLIAFTQVPGGAGPASNPVGGGAGHTSAALAGKIAEARVGYVRADGIGTLRRSALTARDLADVIAADETTAMTWRSGWARLAARSLNAAGNPILADVESALSPAVRSSGSASSRRCRSTSLRGASVRLPRSCSAIAILWRIVCAASPTSPESIR